MSITVDTKPLLLLALAIAAFYLYLSWQSYMTNFRRSLLSEISSKQPTPDPTASMKQEILISQVADLSSHHSNLVSQVHDLGLNHNKLAALVTGATTNHTKLVEQLNSEIVTKQNHLSEKTNEVVERVNAHGGKPGALTSALEKLEGRVAGAGERWGAATKVVRELATVKQVEGVDKEMRGMRAVVAAIALEVNEMKTGIGLLALNAAATGRLR